MDTVYLSSLMSSNQNLSLSYPAKDGKQLSKSVLNANFLMI